MLDPVEFVKLDSVCDQLRGYTDALCDLVAVLTHRGTADRLKLVFNGEPKAEVPRGCEAITIEDLLVTDTDLQEYDGTVIAFSALDLIIPSLITSGPRHCAMEELFRKLGQPSILADNQWSLAWTLFTELSARDELNPRAPDKLPADWLDKAAKLFTLALPRRLNELGHISGLVAVIPHQDLQRYLISGDCTLVYVENDTRGNAFRPIGVDSNWPHTSTARQLCAGFEELAALYPSLDPTQHGFVDLRKAIRRIPAQITSEGHARGSLVEVSHPHEYPGQYANQIQATIAQLATVCRKRAREQGNSKWSAAAEAAMTLEAEHWVSDKLLDGLVAIKFAGMHERNGSTHDSGQVRAYYLTVPDAMSRPDLGDLYSLLAPPHPPTQQVDSNRDGYVVSLRALRRAAGAGNTWRWVPLHEVLFRLDRPDLLASCAFLVSRDLLSRYQREIHDERDNRKLDVIANLAAVACHTYGLANPRRWPHGDYRRHLMQAYDNFDACIDQLEEIETGSWKEYYASLKAWWDRNTYAQKARIAVARDALQGLIAAFPDESSSSQVGRKLHKVRKMRLMFEAMLVMTSEAWDPFAVRERLLQAGFSELASFTVTRPREVFDPNRDPRLPSPLFLVELKRFLALAIQSHEVRIAKLSLRVKRQKIEDLGCELGRRVGVDFAQFTPSSEDDAGGLPGQSTLLFVPWHERLWLEMLYQAALREHKRLTNEWGLQPVEVAAIRPDRVTVKHTIELEIELTSIPERRQNGVTVTLRSPESRQYYVLDENATRELTGSVQTQIVKYNVIFETQERRVPLQITYTDLEGSYSDHYWVTIVGLDAKIGPARNPYVFGRAIDNPLLYYGRQRELKQILDSLDPIAYKSNLGRGALGLQNIHLHGSRRSGKTSLLLILKGIIENIKGDEPDKVTPEVRPQLLAAFEKVHPVWYDMLELYDKPGETSEKHFDFDAFALALIDRICQSLGWDTSTTDRLLSAMERDIRNRRNVVEILTRYLLDVMKSIPTGDYLLILLDELDVLREENDRRSLGYLRTLIGKPALSHIVWVVVTTYGLPEGWESTALGIFLTVPLKRLDDDDARRLVLQPARQAQVHFTPDAVNCILQQTGCRPYLIQIVCYYIVEQLKRTQSTYVDRAQVDAIAGDICDLSEDLRLFCEHLWKRMSGSGKLLLANLAQYSEGSSQEVVRNSTLRQIADRVLHPDEAEIEDMLGKAWEDIGEADMFQDSFQDSMRVNRFAIIPIIRAWVTNVPYSMRVDEAINDVRAEVGMQVKSPMREERHASE